MKLTLMERVDTLGGTPTPDKRRDTITLGIVLGVHATLFWLFNYIPQKTFSPPPPPITVKLVIAPVIPEPPELVEPEAVEPEVAPPPKTPEPEPEPEPEPAPPPPAVIFIPPPAPPQPYPSEIPPPETGNPIPDRWRLPPGSRISLGKLVEPTNPDFQDLSHALNCLGFDADCAEQRKLIFADEQLSSTDLVWMPSHAHSGLSDSDLFGLSEAEIRERLSIPTAGQNGFAILPGIVIDGPLWDKLHGVNKGCTYSVGIGAGGGRELRKHCEELKPSSKDRIRFIPKPVE